jgi:phosphinothricin acetyltransferase
MYQALFPLLEKEDVHRVVAGIAQPNAASNALHERFGFKPIGAFTEVGRKFGKYCNVLWMEKTMPSKFAISQPALVHKSNGAPAL